MISCQNGIDKTILVWFFKLIIRLELVHVLLREKKKTHWLYILKGKVSYKGRRCHWSFKDNFFFNCFFVCILLIFWSSVSSELHDKTKEPNKLKHSITLNWYQPLFRMKILHGFCRATVIYICMMILSWQTSSIYN